MAPKNSAPSPLYKRVYLEIKNNIENGIWKEGQKIPSERELCEFFGVSRITVRRAVGISESEGLIKTIRGLGSFAKSIRHEQPLSRMISFNKTLTTTGVKGSTKIVSTDHAIADLLVENALLLNPGESIVKLVLIGEGDDKPIVQYESYFSSSRGDEIIERARKWESEKKAFSTIDLYRESQKKKPTRIKQTFEATTATNILSLSLKVEEGHPIMKITSIIYSDKTPLEYRVAHYLGEKYKFSTERNLSGIFD